jgi:hypothetical protein
METIKVILRGETPLMLKSDATVDPFNPFTMKIREITDKRGKKTESEQRALRRIEWEAGLYMDEKLGPYVPGWNVIRSLRDGAALSKKGRDVLRGVITSEKIRLEYEGPRTPDAMYDTGKFIDVRRVVAKGGGGATMRARPKFSPWHMKVEFTFDEAMISRRDLLASLETAGKFAGLGEYRPSSPKGGQFGRYTVEVC